MIKRCIPGLTLLSSIIALHGLGGTWDSSWEGQNGYSWICDLLPTKFASSRILSFDCPDLLEYFRPNEMKLSSLVDELIYKRKSAGRAHTPIIFIGHSFGGTLLKQIYVATHPNRETRTDYLALNEAIRAYIYLGTPQQPTAFPEPAVLFRALERQCRKPLGSTIKGLGGAFDIVNRINDDFLQFGGEELPACCFYERKPTQIGLKDVSLQTSILSELWC
jgi:pimeloyl-ACP methyl ester carboxylesterase